MPLQNNELGGPTRRGMLFGAAAVAAAKVGPLYAHRAMATVATGYVFEDVDGTGLRSARSPGIGGVMVSNGRDVTLSARDGSWRLPVGSGDCVFVIKPSHWTALPGPRATQRFFHLHQPDGSPASFSSRFEGVPATGITPDAVDFALRRRREPSRFDVLLVADTQPGNAGELAYVRDSLLARVPGIGAASAIHHGDVMGDDLSLFDRYLELTGATGIPWHHCPGNHDMNVDSGNPRHWFETWKRTFGPTHYAFQHAGATFILLNNDAPAGWAGDPQGERGYRGLVGSGQLTFVENVLRHVPREHLVVVSMHIPLVSFEDPHSPADTTGDRKQLLQLLAKRPHTVSFSGHSHTTEHHYLGPDEGFTGPDIHHHHVLTAACGSWWSGPRDGHGIPYADSRDGSPRGFHVLSVDGSRYRTMFVASSNRPSGQMRVMLDVPMQSSVVPRHRPGQIVERSRISSTRLLVNVFDGGPRTRVSMSFAHAPQALFDLGRVDGCDPYVADFFAANPETCKPWAGASPSSHIWAATLPTWLEAGVHRLEVRARDEYGSEHVEHALIEVTA